MKKFKLEQISLWCFGVGLLMFWIGVFGETPWLVGVWAILTILSFICCKISGADEHKPLDHSGSLVQWGGHLVFLIALGMFLAPEVAYGRDDVVRIYDPCVVNATPFQGSNVDALVDLLRTVLIGCVFAGIPTLIFYMGMRWVEKKYPRFAKFVGLVPHA